STAPAYGIIIGSLALSLASGGGYGLTAIIFHQHDSPMKIAILPGDGIGPEIIEQALLVLNALDEKFEFEQAPVGGAGYEAHGHPLPEGTLKLAKAADAVLFGSVGDWKYDTLERA